MSVRYPSLQQSLRLVRKISPQAITQVVDIGVQKKTDFLIDVFPDLHHHLFEPVSVYYNDLESNYGKVPHTLHKIALSDKSGVLYLHNMSMDGSGRITHSQLKESSDENTPCLVNIENIESKRLDECFSTNDLPPLTYLVKLDVDGIEEKIISGGASVIGNASFVVIETSIGRGDLCSRASLIESHGFKLFDICDNAYYFGQLALVDLVLINRKLRDSEIKFRPWSYSQGKVIWGKWQHGFKDFNNADIDDPF